MLLNTGGTAVPSKNGLLTTVGWRIGGTTTYCLEGAVFIAGAAVQWVRDGLKAIEASSHVEQLSATVADAEASTSCRPSSAWARPTGIRTRAA